MYGQANSWFLLTKGLAGYTAMTAAISTAANVTMA